MMTDPIADMLTRIRNANTAKHNKVDVPTSIMKKSILGKLIYSTTRSPVNKKIFFFPSFGSWLVDTTTL